MFHYLLPGWQLSTYLFTAVFCSFISWNLSFRNLPWRLTLCSTMDSLSYFILFCLGTLCHNMLIHRTSMFLFMKPWFSVHFWQSLAEQDSRWLRHTLVCVIFFVRLNISFHFLLGAGIVVLSYFSLAMLIWQFALYHFRSALANDQNNITTRAIHNVRVVWRSATHEVGLVGSGRPSAAIFSHIFELALIDENEIEMKWELEYWETIINESFHVESSSKEHNAFI